MRARSRHLSAIADAVAMEVGGEQVLSFETHTLDHNMFFLVRVIVIGTYRKGWAADDSPFLGRGRGAGALREPSE